GDPDAHGVRAGQALRPADDDATTRRDRQHPRRRRGGAAGVAGADQVGARAGDGAGVGGRRGAGRRLDLRPGQAVLLLLPRGAGRPGARPGLAQALLPGATAPRRVPLGQAGEAAMSRWRIGIVAALLVLPVLVLAGLGSYYLWANGWAFIAWWPLVGCMALGWALGWYWQHRRQLLHAPEFTPE